MESRNLYGPLSFTFTMRKLNKCVSLAMLNCCDALG